LNTIIHKASQRGFTDYGWLKAAHSFSFANYFAGSGTWHAPETDELSLSQTWFFTNKKGLRPRNEQKKFDE
jgi:hypothetical protein